jgi:hypothetical protein
MTPAQCAYRAVNARRTLPYGQRPTDLHIRVVFLLARWQCPDPSHAKLAAAAHCHRNSVLGALRRLRDLGLLSWVPQFRRLPDGRLAQRASLYSFEPCTPALPVHKSCRPRKEAKETGRQTALNAMLVDAASLPDLLLARRETMAARLLAG